MAPLAFVDTHVHFYDLQLPEVHYAGMQPGVSHPVFGTNWPIDRLFSSYPDVLDSYARIIADFAPVEQEAMFSGNAERIFRI